MVFNVKCLLDTSLIIPLHLHNVFTVYTGKVERWKIIILQKLMKLLFISGTTNTEIRC